MAIDVIKTEINSVYEIYSKCFVDSRGSFLNIFRDSEQEYKEFWGDRKIKQVNMSITKKVGSIRGLHIQREPYSEAKLVRCLKGSVWDVAIDLRKDSNTYGKWHAIELSEKNMKAFFIPKGCGHGFQTLENDSHLIYIHSGNWYPNMEVGVRWNDENLSIQWPVKVTEINLKDQKLPLFKNFEL